MGWQQQDLAQGAGQRGLPSRIVITSLISSYKLCTGGCSCTAAP